MKKVNVRLNCDLPLTLEEIASADLITDPTKKNPSSSRRPLVFISEVRGCWHVGKPVDTKRMYPCGVILSSCPALHPSHAPCWTPRSTRGTASEQELRPNGPCVGAPLSATVKKKNVHLFYDLPLAPEEIAPLTLSPTVGFPKAALALLVGSTCPVKGAEVRALCQLGVTVSVREVPGPFVSGAGRWLKGVVMDRTVNRPPSWKFYSRPRRGPKMRPKGAGGGG